MTDHSILRQAREDFLAAQNASYPWTAIADYESRLGRPLTQIEADAIEEQARTIARQQTRHNLWLASLSPRERRYLGHPVCCEGCPATAREFLQGHTLCGACVAREKVGAFLVGEDAA